MTHSDLELFKRGVETFIKFDEIHIDIDLPFVIPEDFFIMKAFCCVPVIGFIPSMIQRISLDNKIYNTKENDKIIKLINVKNDYEVATVICGSLSTALMIALLASSIFISLGVFSLIFGIVTIGSSLYMIGLSIHQISSNHKTLSALRQQRDF